MNNDHARVPTLLLRACSHGDRDTAIARLAERAAGGHPIGAELQGESLARVLRLVGRVDLHAFLKIRALTWPIEQSQ